MKLKYYTIVQKQSFHILRQNKKNNRKRDAKRQQNRPQIELWAPMGPIFEVLGGVARGPIFDEFLMGPKMKKIWKDEAEV